MVTKLTQKIVDELSLSTSSTLNNDKIYDTAIAGLYIEITDKSTYHLQCGHFNVEIGETQNLTLPQAREKALIYLSEVQHQSLQALTTSLQNVTFIPNIDANISKHLKSLDEILNEYQQAGGSKYLITRIKCHFDLSMAISDIDILWCEQWREKYISQGHKIASGNRGVSALRAVLNWGEKRGLCKSKIKNLKMLPETDSNIITRILSEEEDFRIREALKNFDTIFQAIIIVELNTGIRLKALLSLLWEDIDFDNHAIRLRAATAKNNKTKYVPMNSEAEACLHNLPIIGNYVFTNSKTHIHYKNISKLWKSLLNAAGIENLRFHDLRHNVASQLAMNGVSLYEIGQILTHSDTKVTERYAHFQPDKKLQAMELLAKKSRNSNSS